MRKSSRSPFELNMIAGMHRISTVVTLLACVGFASAQEPAPPLNVAPPEPPQRVVPALPTPQETFGAIGRLIDQSISSVGAGVNAGVKGAGVTIGATSDAAGELIQGVNDSAGTD